MRLRFVTPLVLRRLKVAEMWRYRRMTRQRWLRERALCSRPGGFADAWDAAWDRGAEGAEFAADDDVEALKASGARLAHKYLAEAAPAIKPAAVEVPISGTIAGVPVRGIADILTTDGMVVDVKTASRKPSGLAAESRAPARDLHRTPGRRFR